MKADCGEGAGSDNGRSGGGSQHGRDPKGTGRGAKAWNPSTGESRYPEGTGDGGEEDEEEVSVEEAAGTWFPPEDDVIWVEDCERFMPDADNPRHFPAKEARSKSGVGKKARNLETGETASTFEQARYMNFEYQYRYEDWREKLPCGHTVVEHAGDDNSKDRVCETGDPCLCKPPCVDVQPISAMRDLDFKASMENVRIDWIHGATTENKMHEASMIVAAISLLRRNMDIVRWVECRVTGHDKVRSFLNGEKNGT